MDEQSLYDWVPSASALVGLIVVLFVVHVVLQRLTPEHNRRFRSQVVMTILVNLGLLLILLVIPIRDSTRGQLLSLVGIVASAAIALSSTTFLGNAMAGVMLRSMRNFRTGDFIRTQDNFGRVSERGLFHTEIQTEFRDLTTVPNLYLVTHPVTTIRSSGTIVSTSCSLGYDVPRGKIEKLLLEAANDCELQEGFVHIMELGDFAVTYRVAGLLTNVKQLLTFRAKLRASVLDRLHEGGIEIVSPNFMNQRVLPEDRLFVPPRARSRKAPESASIPPEQIVFDKAEAAETVESLEEEAKALDATAAELKSAIKKQDGDEAAATQRKLERLESRRERLAKQIERRKQEHEQE